MHYQILERSTFILGTMQNVMLSNFMKLCQPGRLRTYKTL